MKKFAIREAIPDGILLCICSGVDMARRERTILVVGLFALGIAAERFGDGASGWYGMAGFFLLALSVHVSIRVGSDRKAAGNFTWVSWILAAIGLASLVMSVIVWQNVS